MRGFSRGDDENAPVNSGEETGDMSSSGGCVSDDNFPFFLLGVCGIIEEERIPVCKNGRCLFEGHAVFFFVAGSLFGVPIELKRFSLFHGASIAEVPAVKSNRSGRFNHVAKNPYSRCFAGDCRS